MSERAAIYELANDIKEIADYIKVSLDFKTSTLVCDVEKAGGAGSNARQILSYIQANNDHEMAQYCCRIDRSLFLLAQSKYSFEPEISLSFSRCHKALFDIQNFILERSYGIPYKDIRECRYAISHVDEKCYKTDDGGNEPQEMRDHEETNSKPQYSDALLSLFRGRVDLIDGLRGLDDNNIAFSLKQYARQFLIENPSNGLRSKYATELKKAGIIHHSSGNFRQKI